MKKYWKYLAGIGAAALPIWIPTAIILFFYGIGLIGFIGYREAKTEADDINRVLDKMPQQST